MNMESIRIYQDQENTRPLGDLRQKQAMAATQQQQKRTILAAINKNVNVSNVEKTKPAIKDKNYRTGLTNTTNNNNRNEPSTSRNNQKSTTVPVVPVAQFQAFKVYEDDEIKMDIQEKLKNKQQKNEEDCKDQEVIGGGGGKSLKIEDVAEIPKLSSLTEDIPIPMSTEKIQDENNSKVVPVLDKGKRLPVRQEDLFFEMEEYRAEIYAYLREHELEHRPKPGYIIKQPDVTEDMRAILVDWLVEVAEEYHLHTETLYLAVNFIDRFLSYMSVVRAKLQLVGTACMFIASKYEEICAPDVGEFVYITDDTYDKSQVIRMEALILRVLGFDLSVPTPYTFITLISTTAKLSSKIKNLALYLSELTILEVERYLQLLPSTIAAASICVARHTLGEEPWSEELIHASGYTLPTLKYAVTFVTDMFIKAPTFPQHAIQDKYKSDKFSNVSKLRPSAKRIQFD